MPRTPIGPTFDTDDVTTQATGTALYGVWVNGYAPLNGGGARDKPLGKYIGRVWQQGRHGWVAAPLPLSGERDSWAAEVERSVRHFRTKREACVFLWGWDLAIRKPATLAAIAAIPHPCSHRGETDR